MLSRPTKLPFRRYAVALLQLNLRKSLPSARRTRVYVFCALSAANHRRSELAYSSCISGFFGADFSITAKLNSFLFILCITQYKLQKSYSAPNCGCVSYARRLMQPARERYATENFLAVCACVSADMAGSMLASKGFFIVPRFDGLTLQSCGTVSACRLPILRVGFTKFHIGALLAHKTQYKETGQAKRGVTMDLGKADNGRGNIITRCTRLRLTKLPP